MNGDGLYNRTLDDAAYVGTLIRFADKHKGQPLRRSVVLAAFTGEEKGLLGAHWFVDHPTVPKAAIVADINLDQLRPLFPLDLLTELAVDDTTLGRTAREVGATMGIRIQKDPRAGAECLCRRRPLAVHAAATSHPRGSSVSSSATARNPRPSARYRECIRSATSTARRTT